MTVIHSIEYGTYDQWRQVATPGISREVCVKALEWLTNVPQFHENPTHISEIFKAVKAGAEQLLRGAIHYGPKLAMFAADVLPYVL